MPCTRGQLEESKAVETVYFFSLRVRLMWAQVQFSLWQLTHTPEDVHVTSEIEFPSHIKNKRRWTARRCGDSSAHRNLRSHEQCTSQGRCNFCLSQITPSMKPHKRTKNVLVWMYLERDAKNSSLRGRKNLEVCNGTNHISKKRRCSVSRLSPSTEKRRSKQVCMCVHPIKVETR